jgi:hypothetical protein
LEYKDPAFVFQDASTTLEKIFSYAHSPTGLNGANTSGMGFRNSLDSVNTLQDLVQPFSTIWLACAL